MDLMKRIRDSIAVASLVPAAALAGGLERANINTSFLYETGSYAEFGFGSVSPSLPATGIAGFFSSDNVAPSFSLSTLAAKTSFGDGLDFGIWYTDNGNGVNIDYGAVGATTIFADLSVPTISALVKFNMNENLSVIAGIKRVSVDSGSSLKLPLNSTTFAQYTLGTVTGSGAVYGLSFKRPDIALRVELLAEEAINLSVPTDYLLNATAVSGHADAGIGDALTLNFQTGIAPNTLLFGSIRDSKWENNQVAVPTFPGGPKATVSSFTDGPEYSLGVGRRVNDNLSLSISAAHDPSSDDGEPVGELDPTGETNSISLGAKISISDNADLSIGGTYSRFGSVTTSTYNASLDNSESTTIGAKIGFKF